MVDRSGDQSTLEFLVLSEKFAPLPSLQADLSNLQATPCDRQHILIKLSIIPASL